MPKNKFTISPKALAKLHAYIDNCKIEVGGFGYIDKNNHIHDVFITKQICSGSETNLDIPDLHQHILKLMDETPELIPQIRFHWHSHVNMDVFWSPTDMKNIGGFNDHWMLFAVLNKNHEMLTKLRVYEPVLMDLDKVDIDVEFDALTKEEIKDIKKELKDKITKETFGMYKHGGYINGRPTIYPYQTPLHTSMMEKQDQEVAYLEQLSFNLDEEEDEGSITATITDIEKKKLKLKKCIELKVKIKKGIDKNSFSRIEEELAILGILATPYLRSKENLRTWKGEIIELLDNVIKRIS